MRQDNPSPHLILLPTPSSEAPFCIKSPSQLSRQWKTISENHHYHWHLHIHPHHYHHHHHHDHHHHGDPHTCLWGSLTRLQALRVKTSPSLPETSPIGIIFFVFFLTREWTGGFSLKRGGGNPIRRKGYYNHKLFTSSQMLINWDTDRYAYHHFWVAWAVACRWIFVKGSLGER